MRNILHITNGDSTLEVMRKAELQGDLLAWRDVLHEGPVPGGLTLNELSEIRAHFIAGSGWSELTRVMADFIARDEQLQRWPDYEKVVLWFEHDLYDQLQLLQILDYFADLAPLPCQLSLINTEHYLGSLPPDQLTALWTYEKPVDGNQLALAKTAWVAFCSSTPQAWYELLHADTSSLPFLHENVMRLLEEYPNPDNGLSRTQSQVLRILSKEDLTAGQLFARYQDTETRRFLGDSCFGLILQQLLESSPPLIELEYGAEFNPQKMSELTVQILPTGCEVLNCKRHWLDCHTLDRWLGGVHLTADQLWCWDVNSQQLHHA